MTPSFRPMLRAGLVPAAMLFVVFCAGCGSEPKPARREGAAPRRAFTPMAGNEEFFAGQILAEVHVGTEGMPHVRPSADGDEDQRPDGGPGSRGGGRSRVNFSGGMALGGMGGGRPPGEGGPSSREFGGGQRRGPGMMGSGGPPVLIHLRFTNRGEAAAELRISDFVSPLGNFVVRPDKLSLQPGESREVEPMSSQLAGAFSETVVTLVLRRGDQVERKSFPVKTAPTLPKEN